MIVAWDAELEMEEKESTELEQGSGVEDVNKEDGPLALGHRCGIAT